MLLMLIGDTVNTDRKDYFHEKVNAIKIKHCKWWKTFFHFLLLTDHHCKNPVPVHIFDCVLYNRNWIQKSLSKQGNTLHQNSNSKKSVLRYFKISLLD